MKRSTESGEGYKKAIEILRKCSTEDGFLASATHKENYRRIWGRDGTIVSLAALLSGDQDLIDTARKTFETLGKYQGPHGEIPSNVDTVSGRISYGGTTGRVDADLWYVIGCAEYWRRTGDDDFLSRMLNSMEAVRFLLGAWEFNNRGLLYVPPTGDWADEYLHTGYVLYDQLLYYQAQICFLMLHKHLHGSGDHTLKAAIERLKHMIRANYWFDAENPTDDIYHEVMYEKGLKAAAGRSGKYWMSFFSPAGYGYRFDAFANVLVSLLDIADNKQRKQVDSFIDEISPDELRLIPAFYPVIKPIDKDWKELQMRFSYRFKNRPYEYHNGGLWPFIGGFYVADLAKRGQQKKARTIAEAVDAANALEMNGDTWSFPEYVNGEEFTAQGMQYQAWSAAATIMGYHALKGSPVFSIGLSGL